MTGRVERRFSERRGLAGLWFGVLAGPAAWAVHLQASYVIVQYACNTVWGEPLLHLVTLLTLAVTAAGAWVSWRSWTATRDGATDHAGVRGRSVFMALSGLALSAYFLLVIAAEGLPNFILTPCH